EVLDPMPRIRPRRGLLRRLVRGQHHVLRAIAVGVDPDLPARLVPLDDLPVQDLLRPADAADVVRDPGGARALPRRPVDRGGRPPHAVEDDLQRADPNPVVTRFGAHAIAKQRAERVAPAAVQVAGADDVVEAEGTGSWRLAARSR